MTNIGTKTETIRCSLCNNLVKATVLSEYLERSSIKGVSIIKDVKLSTHKKSGFLSTKCKMSGFNLSLKVWHRNDKVRKTQCRHCKRTIDAYILTTHHRRSRITRDVYRNTTTIIMKLLYHKKGSRKCSGTGQVTKEKKVDIDDCGHP